MPEMTPHSSRTSLDDLLKANREQFERVFSAQMGGAATAAQTAEQPSATTLSTPTRARGGATDMLLARFGGGWSSQIVEHKVERGVVTVLCRLTVDGIVKEQFGSARIGRSQGEAMSEAVDDALGRCIGMFGDDVRPVAQIEPAPAAGDGQRQKAPPAGEGGAFLPTAGVPVAVDGITLDVVEGALRDVQREMEAVLLQSAASPSISGQRDAGAIITDPRGRMIAGQFGSYVAEMLKANDFDLHPGDVILQSDPYGCGGAVSHINDWTVLVPVFFDDALVGFTSMYGHMADVGGPVAGSRPVAATSVFGEGMRIPPVKIHDRGQPNQAALDILRGNSRNADMNDHDLAALIAACRAGARGVVELCARFGVDGYRGACDGLLERANHVMRRLIAQTLPEEPQTFEDVVDDDGLGNGPFRMRLTVWREGDNAYFDWTGTAPQAPGPINFYLHDGLFRLSVGAYLFAAFDPAIQANDGFHDLIHVNLPKGSLLQPDFPAALGGGSHSRARQFDVLGGALGRHAPDKAPAAGYGAHPTFQYAGRRKSGRAFHLTDIVAGGLPGRPDGDGPDGYFASPHHASASLEHLESRYPIIIESCESIADSGGAGTHRGGNAFEKIYLLLEPGVISISDDRHASAPWGILGGKAGACSQKWLQREGGEREALPAKADNIRVGAGDRVIFRTAGAGGWGDPLKRDVERVRADVARRLVSPAKARDDYGVMLVGSRLEVDQRATEALREKQRRSRKPLELFDHGERRGAGAPANGVESSTGLGGGRS